MPSSFSKASRSPRFLFILFFLAAVYLAVASEKNLSVLGVFWSPVFLQAIRIFCMAAFFLLILKRFIPRLFSAQLLKWVYGLLFLPLLLLPVFRCYFKVPYVFCRACPQPCPWGMVRTFAFNSFILLNVFNKFWCAGLCPFGTFQECQTQLSKKSFKISPRVAFVSAYLALWGSAAFYFLTFSASPWLLFFERGGYGWVGMTVSVATVILVIAFVIPKFWCRFFCPIGTIAQLTAGFKGESKNNQIPESADSGS